MLRMFYCIKTNILTIVEISCINVVLYIRQRIIAISNIQRIIVLWRTVEFWLAGFIFLEAEPGECRAPLGGFEGA